MERTKKSILLTITIEDLGVRDICRDPLSTTDVSWQVTDGTGTRSGLVAGRPALAMAEAVRATTGAARMMLARRLLLESGGDES